MNGQPARFKKKGKKWYNWSDAESQKQWDDAVRDPKGPRCYDAFGNLCLAKLDTRVLAQGAQVGTSREVREGATHSIDAGSDPQEMQRIREGAWCLTEF